MQGAHLQGAELQGAHLQGAELQGAGLRGAELQGADLGGVQLQGADLVVAELQGADLTRAELQGASLRWAQLQGADLTGADLQGSRGEPASWYLVWMPDVSVDFSGSSERYLEELLSDEIKDIKLAWQEGVTLEQHLKQSLNGGSDRGVFDGAKPDDTDWVFHQRKDANWPEEPDVHSDNYWDAWAKWESEFACENEYTARSSLERWSLSKFGGTPRRPDAPDFLFFLYEENIYDRARNKIREALSDARAQRDLECAGLRDLSENEWQEFVDG